MISLRQRRALPAFAAILLIGGCTWNGGPAFSDGSGLREKFGWTEERALRHGWLQARVIETPAVYCYRTLATAECFATPQPEARNRLIGHFGPSPD